VVQYLKILAPNKLSFPMSVILIIHTTCDTSMESTRRFLLLLPKYRKRLPPHADLVQSASVDNSRRIGTVEGLDQVQHSAEKLQNMIDDVDSVEQVRHVHSMPHVSVAPSYLVRWSAHSLKPPV
jgi:hypothetical protein